jgi:AcrR family transcriptional regulator
MYLVVSTSDTMNAMPTAQGKYRGLSAADRQRERRGRLLEAALEIMAAEQWRTATVDQVCTTAGLNKRYFYESFTALDALAAAVVDDIAAEVGQATLAAFAAALAEPLEHQALLSVRAVVKTLVVDPRRARVLLGGVAASAAVNAHRTTVMNGLTQILVAHARLIHGVELESDPLAQVAPTFVVGGTAEAILAFVNGTATVTVDELISELANLWLIVGDGAARVARARVCADGVITTSPTN